MRGHTVKRRLHNLLTLLSLLLCVAVVALSPATGRREDSASSSAPAGAATFDAAWADRSPHESRFATLDGVRLHYLDWGGSGPALLFLHGLGDTAHIFDDLAPAFSDRLHVLGLTRRGHGRSDKPEGGYDTATLVEDVRKFLDQLKVGRVTLAGHSIAGDELTAFAVKYPDRVDKLVYLDAAFRRGAMRDVFTKAPPQLQPGPDDVKSYGSFRTLLTRLSFWSESWDANLREMMVLDERGVIVRQAMPPAVSRSMMQGTMEFVPEYEKVAAPALNIAAVGWSAALERHVQSLPPAERGQAQAFRDDVLVPRQRAEIDRFRKGMRNGRVVELPDTDHHCFIQRRDQVAREMRAFLSGD